MAALSGVGSAALGHGGGALAGPGGHCRRVGRRSTGTRRICGMATASAMSADHLDRLLDSGPFLSAQVVESGLDAGDQRPDPADLLLGGHGLLVCPLVELGAGEKALAVALATSRHEACSCVRRCRGSSHEIAQTP